MIHHLCLCVERCSVLVVVYRVVVGIKKDIPCYRVYCSPLVLVHDSSSAKLDYPLACSIKTSVCPCVDCVSSTVKRNLCPFTFSIGSDTVHSHILSCRNIYHSILSIVGFCVTSNILELLSLDYVRSVRKRCVHSYVVNCDNVRIDVYRCTMSCPCCSAFCKSDY